MMDVLFSLSDTLLGESPINRNEVDGWSSAIFIPNPHLGSKVYGLVDQWNVYLQKSRDVTCQIWRNKGNSKFTLIGETTIKSGGKTGLIKKQLPYSDFIPIKPGDLVGFKFTNGAVIGLRKTSCSSTETDKFALYVQPARTVAIGSSTGFSRKLYSWGPCRQYSVQAHVKGKTSYEYDTHTVQIAYHTLFT